MGRGFLSLSCFRDLIRDNPHLKEIELSNYGEIFLNPDLLGILEHAYERGVTLRADNGVNFNRVSDEVLEGLVKYRFLSMTCSIDGVCEETYRRYRVNGSLSGVLDNIRRLNAFKSAYRSDLPHLLWQFVVLGHNEHELSQAREMARVLGMSFHAKLSWDPHFSPVTDRELVRAETGAADRDEYRRRFGVDYSRGCCLSMWTRPQINWDGRVLGCARNFWGDYGANAFSEGLVESINSPRIRYARQMLRGKKPPKDDVPCATCSLYLDMKAEGAWVTGREIRRGRRGPRTWPPERVRRSAAWRGARSVYRWFRPADPNSMMASRVYPLHLPLPPDEESGWASYGIFAGRSQGMGTLSCHVSVLTPGTCPHPPHAHEDEEILMLLSGEVELTVADGRDPAKTRRTGLRPGQFVYYPRRRAHTLQTTSAVPAEYLMFKWTADRAVVPRWIRARLPHGLFDSAEPERDGRTTEGFSSRMIFSGPTDYLRKLSCHTSVLAPGGGYAPHADPYDVAMVALEGEVETLGQRVGPYGVIFYAAGVPHGIHNPTETAARYVVFEFHGRGRGLRRSIG